MFHDLIYRIRMLLWRGRAEDELEEELQFHLENQTAKYVQAGMAHDAAARRARIDFGGVTQVKERTRQSWGIGFVESLLKDARFALRGFRRNPVFTITVVLTLAIGIGANTAIFTLMDAVMWRMLPVENPETLMRLGIRRNGTTLTSGVSYRNYRMLLENIPEIELAGYATTPLNASIDGSSEPAIQGQLVTGNYFSLLGVKPLIGRAIGTEDDRKPNSHPVVMLSHDYWNSRFAGDPSVIGHTIRFSAMPFTIIGVTPPEFSGVDRGTAPAVFLPIMMQPTVMSTYENLIDNPINRLDWVRVIGRADEGATPDRVSARITMMMLAALEFKGGPPPEDLRFVLNPVNELSEIRMQFSTPLMALFGMVGIMLLIACTNAANLLLARAATRRPEFAMRLALGAGRRRLIRQLIVESVLLASFAGVCGIILARWITELLVVFVSVGRTPLMLDLDPNPHILMFTAAVSVLTGILFGLAPAIGASKAGVIPTLKNMGVGSRANFRHLQPGRVLAGVQIALSLLLLVGAGLFIRSLQNLNNRNSGISPDSVLTARVEPQGSDQRNLPGTTERLDRIYGRMIERMKQIPGVRRATMANSTPGKPTAGAGFRLTTATGDTIPVPMLMAYPDYFAAVGMPLVRGRDFNLRDLDPHSPPVCVVNEVFVREMFPAGNPVGQTCVTIRMQDSERPVVIAGVVGDSRYTNPRGETRPVIYMPFMHAPTGRGQMVLFVQTDENTRDMRPEIREALASVDPRMPMFEIHTLSEELAGAQVQERLLALLSGVYGIVALLLTSIGLYGLMAFSVLQRTGEIGIRLALGSGRARVVWLVMRETLMVLGIGIIVGIAAVIMVSRILGSWISALLFRLKPTDPTMIIAAVLGLAAVVLVAAFLPARRATRLDPLVTLREE
jgi:predicted permease